MGYQDVKNSRQRLKQRLIEIAGGKCCICGYNKCTSALEFHHINPEEKEFSIGGNTNVGFLRAVEEIKKCILVCANCHREIHEGLIENIPETSYDETKKEEIYQQHYATKADSDFICKYCGVQVYRGNDCCPTCAHQRTRQVERPSREVLKNQIRTLAFTDIGKLYGVSDNTIRKWCIAFDLPNTKSAIKQYSNELWEQL